MSEGPWNCSSEVGARLNTALRELELVRNIVPPELQEEYGALLHLLGKGGDVDWEGIMTAITAINMKQSGAHEERSRDYEIFIAAKDLVMAIVNMAFVLAGMPSLPHWEGVQERNRVRAEQAERGRRSTTTTG